MKESGSEQQQRLQLLGSISGGLAHDLNNILTGILGHIAFLKLSLPAEGQHKDSLQAIEEGGRRAAQILQQLLEFAKGESHQKKSVNLIQIVISAVNLLRIAFPKNIQLQTNFSDDTVNIEAHESQISQLVMNLVINARDALPDGGTTELFVDKVYLDGSDDIAEGYYARLSIVDDGHGMPAEIKKKIFEPFFTTKFENGTGLGLSNVLGIVRGHGGTITVESEQGSGTRFDVYLPLHFLEEEVSEEPPKHDLPKGEERILVVEDEDIVRTVMQKSLELLGYEVEATASGYEALRLYETQSYDLVIVDIMMPEMSGDELFFRLKKVDSNVPVLIASGYSSEERSNAILSSGGLGFIQKPFAVDELAKEVRRCLDEKGSTSR
jgi:two-component system cell cycle sensor histidine kinase/response regulator CckA